jgi:hypothetical protein
MGVGGQRHTPAALSPGKTRYSLYRKLGGSQSRSGQVRKISSPSGFDPRTVQPVAIRYIDRYPRAIPVHPVWAFINFPKVNFTCCIPFQLRVAYVNQRISHVCNEIIMRFSAPAFVWTERLDDSTERGEVQCSEECKRLERMWRG